MLDRWNRRDLIKGGAALGAFSLARPALADNGGKVVIGSWGGDYQTLQMKHIEPLLRPKGIEVLWDIGQAPERRTKALAEKRLPRGTVDILCLAGADSFQMHATGVVEEIDWSKLPNASNLLPALKTKYSVPHIYTGRVILYNPGRISPAPTSYTDLWDPKWKDKVGIIDIQYQSTIESAALIAGGSVSNFEPGKAKLMELKQQGVKIVPTNEAMAQAMKNEEIWLCIMWKARAVQWQNQGVPVKVAVPKEGVGLFTSEYLVPKNAPNKAQAYAWLNASMEPSAQAGFAQDMGYNGSVSNYRISDELKARIGFTPEEEKALFQSDYAYLAKQDAQLKDWWDKVFKA